jgi:membrane-associated protein
VGYLIGRKIGKRIFNKEDSLFFKKKYVDQTKAFYDKHGSKTIVIARFVPIIRTFAPTMAGVGEMEYKTFLTYNVVGGIGWVLSMTCMGYFLGHIPGIEKVVHYIILAIIALSFVPVAIEVWKSRSSEPAVE